LKTITKMSISEMEKKNMVNRAGLKAYRSPLKIKCRAKDVSCKLTTNTNA
jgi:hypothetical protein